MKGSSSLRWLEILSGMANVIGITGMIILIAIIMIQRASAEPTTPSPADRHGFESGPRTFSNPYAPTTPPESYIEGDNEDSMDFPSDDDFGNTPFQGNTGMNQRFGGQPNQNGAPGNTGMPMGGARPGVPMPQRGGGLSVGGTPPGGVVQGRAVPTLSVDTETGEGCKEVITDFNFPDADILDIAKTLGKLMGKNFILDKDVKGRISIISNAPITCGDAWKAFLTALDINGFALIPSGKYVRIARQRDARDKQLRTYTGDFSPDTDALITRVFPLKYLSADEVARNFRSFMPANSRIIPYDQTNTVIVTDTGSNIAKLSKLLDILDVEGYDAGIEVIPVKFASAAELSRLVDTLIPGTGSAGAPGAPRFGVSSGRFAARRTKEGGVINTIIADERTNTLIVHANGKGADQVRELVAKLDQKLPATTGGGKVNVIYLQFAEAEQLSNTLNNLGQGAGGGRTTSPAGGGTGVNPIQTSLFEGNIKISPDKATNALVVTASPSDFVTLQRVVNKLDIPRDQVYAEVVIMELTLGRNFDFSTNVISPSSGIGFTPNTDLLDFINNPLSSKGAVLGFKSGGTVEVPVNGQNVKVSSVQGLIRALQTNSNANILATPQILTLDNTEATFDTTEKIPVPTTTAVQGAGVSTSITKENVSLSISIKPQINKLSNFVKLDINAKLADISRRELPSQVASLALATLERNAKTSIVVANEDTVVLGGLTRDNQQETVSKIPVLGDIPLLGWLFRARHTESTKTNLLIFITPHVIRQYDSIRTVLDKKLRERDEFLESNTGGEDPARKYRDDLIRNLPDIKKVTENQPSRVQTIEKEEEPATPAPSAIQTPAAPATNSAPATPSTSVKPVTPPAPKQPVPPVSNVNNPTTVPARQPAG